MSRDKTIVYPELFVGANMNRGGEGHPLGFMCHYLENDAACEKRMKTIKDWCQRGKGGWKIVKNDAVAGFEILDVISRYRTDNKVFRVLDPRGYELEINAYNLFNLLATTRIDNGKILDELVWARRGATNLLIKKDSDEFRDGQWADILAERNKAAQKLKSTKNAVGMHVAIRGDEYVYLGKMYVRRFSYIDNNPYNYGYYYRRNENINLKYSATLPVVLDRKYHVYQSVSKGPSYRDNAVESYEYEIRSTPIKDTTGTPDKAITEADYSDIGQVPYDFVRHNLYLDGTGYAYEFWKSKPPELAAWKDADDDFKARCVELFLHSFKGRHNYNPHITTTRTLTF